MAAGARLSQAVGRPGVAAFDFDGTLVPGDSLRPFLAELLGRAAPWREAAAAPAAVVGYRRGGRDGAKAALLGRLLAGMDAAHFEAVARRFGEALATRVSPAMAEVVDSHRHRGHRLVVVSASLAAYLEPFAAATGLDDVVATRVAVGDDGVLTGSLVGGNVRGGEKQRRLSSLLGDPASVELWAYGDSAGDTEMLAMADHPVWVRDGVPSAAARSARLA